MSGEMNILPCPFCSHVGLDFGEGSTFRWLTYSCAGCGVGSETRIQTLGEGDFAEWRAQAEADAIAAWNTRASPPPPEDGWMDIDDAAKSGKWVLLSGRCYRAGAPAMVCRWDGCEWESADDGCGTYIMPTHWRPLPPPPAALTKEQHD